MGLNFLPWCKLWLQDRCMWSMSRDGQEVWSRTDNILRTDRRLFQDVDVRDPQQKSDHYMVLGCLWGEAVKELTEYLRKAHRFPLRNIRHDLPCASEKIFSDRLSRRSWEQPPLNIMGISAGQVAAKGGGRS